MRIALDTNVLAYAEGVNGPSRRKEVLQILDKLEGEEVFVAVQALGELFHVLVRKAGRSPVRARQAVLGWLDAYPSIETSSSVLLAALDLAVDHEVSTWDAMILGSCAGAGCRLLLSEDMQDGFTWSGVTVVNPFKDKRHELLAGLLEK